MVHEPPTPCGPAYMASPWAAIADDADEPGCGRHRVARRP
jgi:hypothetical protein